jgi:subtilisin family serine protease
VISHAAQVPGTIINLSLRSTARIEAIETEADNSRSTTLFVVAAGNQENELDAGGYPKESAYPAVYGGNRRARVLTVAALDGRGGLAPFSNWSPTLVDVGAPGCFIPVLSVSSDGTHLLPTRRNGTSLAAPLVSFAAAIVRAETGAVGERLKRRILAASDLTPGTLAQKIIDGRRLNIIKAAAVSSDVVETGSGLEFGEIAFMQGATPLHDGQKVTLKCENSRVLTPAIETIIKMARFGGTAGQPLFRVYIGETGDQNPNAPLESALCETPTDWSLRLTKYQGAQPAAVPFTSLRDFVPRYRMR